MRRRLPVHIMFGALAVFGSLTSPVHAEKPNQVPTADWAYDVVSMFAQRGVWTGFPDGTFAGRREVTREDFAVAIHTMLADTLRRSGEGQRWSLRPYAGDPKPLRKLIREFAPELAARGVDPRVAAQGADRFEEIWQDPTPRGVSAPLPGVRAPHSSLVWPEHRGWQELGEDAARRELQRGEVSLWYLREGSELPNHPNALLLRPAVGRSPREQVQQLIGHNRVVWAALSDRQSLYRTRWNWLRQVFEPQEVWRNGKALKVGRSSLPLGKEHLLEPSRHFICEGPLREHHLDGRFVDAPFTHSLDLRVLPCANGSEMVIVGAGPKPQRYYVLELRTGAVLNIQLKAD